jgi:hypothetical protein
VYFGQKHVPGRLCASDFTHMTELGITLEGQTFEHLVYHFVLTYSNWETCVCQLGVAHRVHVTRMRLFWAARFLGLFLRLN